MSSNHPIDPSRPREGFLVFTTKRNGSTHIRFFLTPEEVQEYRENQLDTVKLEVKRV